MIFCCSDKRLNILSVRGCDTLLFKRRCSLHSRKNMQFLWLEQMHHSGFDPWTLGLQVGILDGTTLLWCCKNWDFCPLCVSSTHFDDPLSDLWPSLNINSFLLTGQSGWTGTGVWSGIDWSCWAIGKGFQNGQEGIIVATERQVVQSMEGTVFYPHTRLPTVL